MRPAHPVGSMRRRVLQAAAVGLAIVGGLPQAAVAQSWPTRPVTVVVPQAAGGTNDIVARLYAQKLSERIGQQFVVMNQPGAGGNIGTAAVAKAPKDGYTLLLTVSSAQAINPSLYKNPGFDPVRDFEPIALIGSVPNVLVVNPAFEARSLAELLTMARAQPDKHAYASAGNGTLNHLLGAMLGSMAGAKMMHIPYKGVAPAMADVIGGQVPVAFASLPSALPHIKAGRLRALGVSSAKRSAALPEVPAIAEAIPGFSGDLWIGLFAPAGTPKDVVQRLVDESAKLQADADVKERLAAQGVETFNMTPQQFAAFMKDDIARWAKIVKESGATID